MRTRLVPRPFDVPHECRVHDHVAEWLDERHVALPEQTAGLDVDGHLALVVAFALIHPGEVQHRVHGPVRQLCGEFVFGAIEGRERRGAEVQVRRVAQIVGQPVGERGLVRTRYRQSSCGIRRAVGRRRDPAEVEPTAEAIAGAPQDTRRQRRRARKVEGHHDVEQGGEVAGATVGRKGPDVLDREVRRDLVDAPGMSLVDRVRNPHREPRSPSAEAEQRGLDGR